MLREIAPVVVIDKENRLLLQQRDDVPHILYPGRIGLFGGHREDRESFLDCAVREIHEELSLFVPRERFVHLTSLEGPDFENPQGTLRAEFFLIRDVDHKRISVTEGRLHVSTFGELEKIQNKLTPSACHALRFYGLLR